MRFSDCFMNECAIKFFQIIQLINKLQNLGISHASLRIRKAIKTETNCVSELPLQFGNVRSVCSC